MAAKRKKKPDPEKRADDVSDLLELAEKVNLPEGYLENEVHDACDEAAILMQQTIMAGTLMGQLEFLMDHGYQPGRLKELIEEGGMSSE